MYCVVHEEEPPNKDEEHDVEEHVVGLVKQFMEKGSTRSSGPSVSTDDRLTPAEFANMERFVEKANPKQLETIINMCAKRLRTG